MCFDRMDPARCSAVAVIQPFRSFCLPGTCAWIAAGPTLRGLPCDARPICPLSAGYVGTDLCVSMVCETPCVRRGLIGPGGPGPVFAYRKMLVSQFSVVPVLSQSKTGTTVLSCGNISEYFSEYQSVEQGSMRDCEWSAHSHSQSRIDPCGNVRHYQ